MVSKLVTVAWSTISNNSVTFLRDVLRNTTTDTQNPARTASNWIFEGEPVGSRIASNLPQVYIDLADMDYKRNSLDIATSTKFTQPILSFHIEVWASGSSGQANRDTIGDEIMQDLTNPASTDGTNSIKSQYLVFKDLTSRNSDRRIGLQGGTVALMRVKEIDIRFRYIGE